MTTVKKEHVAIIVCYPNDWHWVLSIEAAEWFKTRYCEVSIVDFSDVGEKILRTLARRAFKREYLGNSLKKSKRFTTQRINPNIYYEQKKREREALRNLPNESTTNFRGIFPTLVESTGRISINTDEHKKLIRRELSKYVRTAIRCERLLELKFDRVVTVNGRFTKNFAVVDVFRSFGTTVNLVEFGSTKEKFQIYRQSPHSIKERMLLMQELHQGSDMIAVKRIGADYITNLRSFDPWAAYSWTSGMLKGSIPKEWEEKRICTFFSSTQREFIGVQDEIQGDKFKNQVEAFRFLVKFLNPEEWNLVLRRHPRKAGQNNDEEEDMWREFVEIPNVFEVQPESKIDSYELAECSEVVAHFNSSIGPELIFQGHKKVITLGPTMWEYLSPVSHLSEPSKLKVYLENPGDISHNIDITPWGFYLKRFGEDFSYFKWSDSEGIWTD
jgi:hypothetical protein